MTTHTQAAPRGTSEPTHEKSASEMGKSYSLFGYVFNLLSIGDDHPNAAPAANAPPVAVYFVRVYYNKKVKKMKKLIIILIIK